MSVNNNDHRIRVTVNGNGSPLTISGLADLEIILYQDPKKIIQRWKKSTGNITTITDAAGLVEVKADRANMIGIPIKDLKIEVVVFTTDVAFEGGVMRNTDTNVVLSELEDSVTGFET